MTTALQSDSQKGGKHDPFDDDRAEKFLEALRQSPNISAAARAARVCRSTVYDWRESNAEFAAAWNDALAEAIDNLEGECYRRSFQGVTKPVFYKGEECGGIQEYSDTLAIFLLKGHRPERYREKFEHTGEISFRPVVEVPTVAPSIEDWKNENQNKAAAGGAGVADERTSDSATA